MHTLALPAAINDTASRPRGRIVVRKRPGLVAVGIAVCGFLAVIASVWWSLPHLPHQFAPVMTLGLPDLPASLDALLFAAQVLADAPVPPAPAVPAVPAVPVQLPPLQNVPGLETVLVNLGGWAAILWGLANKIINRLDQRIVQIELRLEHLGTIPDGIRNLRRELRRYRMTPHAHPLPGKESPEEHPA
jgi:hypothetical protein